MPKYEYECDMCGQFEIYQKITDPKLTKCPQCKSNAHRLISSTTFQLKGGGWANDSYSKKYE